MRLVWRLKKSFTAQRPHIAGVSALSKLFKISKFDVTPTVAIQRKEDWLYERIAFAAGQFNEYYGLGQRHFFKRHSSLESPNLCPVVVLLTRWFRIRLFHINHLNLFPKPQKASLWPPTAFCTATPWTVQHELDEDMLERSKRKRRVTNRYKVEESKLKESP